MVSAYGSWDDPALDPEGIAWTRDTMNSLREWEHPGRYLNYVSQDESLAESVQMYGAEIYSRLAEVKRRYDPDNLFRGARGIVPASTGPAVDPAATGIPTA